MDILLGILFAITAMLGWGVADFLAKKVIDKYGGFQTLIISQALGLIPVFIMSLFAGVQMPTTGMAALIIFAAFITAAAYLSFYKGLEIGQASVVTPIASASAVVILILSLVFLNEKLAFYQFVGISLVIAGILLMSFKEIKKAKIAKGVPLGLIAMLGWGFNSFFYVFILKEINVLFSVFCLRSISVLFLSASSKFKRIKFSFPKKNILLLLLIMGVLDTFALVFFQYGLKMGLLSLVGPISSSYAGVTAVLAYIFLEEKLRKNQIVGIVLLILGIILVSLIS